MSVDKTWLEAKEMRHAVIRSTLAEIYLLVDNITSTLNRKLPDIAGLKDKSEISPPVEWLNFIGSVQWPPAKEDMRGEAETAAKLILIRDALNEAAAPATGASIAYTLFVAGDGGSDEKNSHTLWFKIKAKIRGWLETKLGLAARAPTGQAGTIDRFSLADIAFPFMRRKADGARRCVFYINPALMALIFLFTIGLSYDAARGTALAGQYSSLVEATQKLEKQIFERDKKNPDAKRSSNSSDGSLDAQLAKSTEDKDIAQANLEIWCDANWRFYFLSQPSAHSKISVTYRINNVQQGLVVLGALISITLPGLYGTLGAMTGQVRRIHKLIGENRLMPRHVRSFFIPWLLGTVAGATIGLFFAASGPTGATDGNAVSGLANSLHLSTSAITFLAGFGVDAVFDTLDSLVRRVFNVTSGEKGAKL
jgi:hypothetical protein